MAAAPSSCKTAKPEDGAIRLTPSKDQIYRDGEWKEVYDQYSPLDSAKTHWLLLGFEWDDTCEVWLMDGKTPAEKGYDVLYIAGDIPLSSSDEDEDMSVWDSD